MGEMIGNIAHQWRQPLNVLGLIVQDLRLRHDIGELEAEHLEESTSKAFQTIQHLSQTIDDFRNFFKPEKDKSQFSISEVAERTIHLLEKTLQMNEIQLELETKETPMTVGYPNEYAQVLVNLIQNARDAFDTRPEITDRLVKLTITEEGTTAVLTVFDNAGGIPEDVIPKIFDPYFTTKGPDKGTGLGLFMSKTIIERNMGGRLTVKNVAGGTECRIETEKVLQAGAGGTTLTAIEGSEPEPDDQYLPRKVLVAEDDRLAGYLLQQLLILNGIEMDLGETGLEILEKLDEREYDLILMDVQMPKMDGLTATQLIREKENLTDRHIPIIAMTAGGTPEDEQRCLAAGMDAYILKPFNFERDKHVIQKVMMSGKSSNHIRLQKGR